MSEQARREALAYDAAWSSGYAAGRAAERAQTAALREAAEPILDRCLDFFGADDLDPESSEAMPVVIKNRWVYALRAALAADGAAGETEREGHADDE